MNIWWESLTSLQRIFAMIAIPASVLMILQTILLLMGMGQHDVDSEAVVDSPDLVDTDHGDLDHNGSSETNAEDGQDRDNQAKDHGLRLFSLRGFVAFFSIAGWTGVLFLGTSLPKILSIMLAFCAGTLALLFVAYVMKAALRLQENGTLRLENAMGKTATVYLTIPAQGQGMGKVSILVQESYREVDAFTKESDPIKTGTQVTVAGISGSALEVRTNH